MMSRKNNLLLFGSKDEHYETEKVLNSNLMILDFLHIIKIRLAPLKFFFVAS